ncbi:MAG: DUF1353 domain-containing protein [Betaproteobacteria bacterium]|nr:DUF1353 domain-containing protein [Betaproteobacteria bacterium]
MSSFTTPADLRMLDSYHWRLLAPFEYHVGRFPSIVVISVPAGFITDLATIPRVLWSIFPPHGKYAKAAIIHDYLYNHAIRNKRWADDIFLEAMRVLKVPCFTRTLMYWAVRLFGRGNYR